MYGIWLSVVYRPLENLISWTDVNKTFELEISDNGLKILLRKNIIWTLTTCKQMQRFMRCYMEDSKQISSYLWRKKYTGNKSISLLACVDVKGNGARVFTNAALMQSDIFKSW